MGTIHKPKFGDSRAASAGDPGFATIRTFTDTHEFSNSSAASAGARQSNTRLEFSGSLDSTPVTV